MIRIDCPPADGWENVEVRFVDINLRPLRRVKTAKGTAIVLEDLDANVVKVRSVEDTHVGRRNDIFVIRGLCGDQAIPKMPVV